MVLFGKLLGGTVSVVVMVVRGGVGSVFGGLKVLRFVRVGSGELGLDVIAQSHVVLAVIRFLLSLLAIGRVLLKGRLVVTSLLVLLFV